ncbi:MAG TPA: ATP-binding protein [Anaerolineales bacterium]
MSTKTYPAKFENLDEVREHVGEVARAAGFDERLIYSVQLAADEAASNIIEHAYADKPNQTFLLHCEFSKGRLIMTFLDRGESFDFSKVETPDVTADLSKRKIGGLGIFLMHKLMDEVIYRVTDSGNYLTLIKRKA